MVSEGILYSRGKLTKKRDNRIYMKARGCPSVVDLYYKLVRTGKSLPGIISYGSSARENL